jgi:phospholipid/cholesterol/gamma-HCH transport system ATP-binding protein
MTTSPLIAFQNVSVQFGKTVIHRDISFTVDDRQVVTLLGPSGTGKTVLLKLLIGLLLPTSGSVIVEGKDLSQLNRDEMREMRKEVGMLFQGAALFDSLTVFENIAFPLREYGQKDESLIAAVVEEKLGLVGLSGFAQRFPIQLSGGQRKRVGLARALASSPRVVLFDEPTTGLDPTSRNRIDDLIIQLRDDLGITSIVVTHDMESARRISDRIILLSQGRVIVDAAAPGVWEDAEPVRRFARGEWSE